jgi:DNA-binding transcriptional MerR regulator
MPSDDAPTRLTIGQLASRCQVPRTTILYYEQVGLLAPAARSAAGYRLYDERELARVQQIGAWRAAGLQLGAIRALLARLGAGELSPAPAASFAGLFHEMGLDDAAMHRWHAVFARQNPAGHKAFLLGLGLSEEDVARIQAG